MKASPFQDKVAIVTGASSGIGRSMAIQLAAQGAKVVLAARRADMLETAVSECHGLPGEALAIPTDVTDEAQCKALVERTIERFGRLDMLVANAGLAVTALLEDFPDLHLFRHTMDVNFYGAVHCTYYALPHIIRSKGRIVAISSLGGKAALPYNTPYIASKYALQGFCDSLRIEMVRHGVSVTVVCPSWVVTGFHEAQMNKDGVAKGAAGRAVYSKRMMTADQCAAITLKAAAKRKREILMGPGRLAVWLNALAPQVVDWIAVKVFLGGAIRRAKAGQRNNSNRQEVNG